jgi:hypothetical protein
VVGRRHERPSVGDGFRVGLGVWLATFAVAALVGVGVVAARWWFGAR